MLRLVVLTFGFLGWAFYEVSDGNNDTTPEASATDATTQHAFIIPAVLQTETETIPGPKTQASIPLRSLVSDAQPIRKPTLQDDLRATNHLTKIRTGEISVEGSVGPTQHALSTVNVKMVRGNFANLRNGPGKRYGVVTSLKRGQRVEIIDQQRGWVMLKVLGTGAEGWMAEFLLVDPS